MVSNNKKSIHLKWLSFSLHYTDFITFFNLVFTNHNNNIATIKCTFDQNNKFNKLTTIKINKKIYINAKHPSGCNYLL